MGRKKQFDEQQVLDKALLCFWKYGYKNTTVRQLEKEMGINQFSIYSNFENKAGLYRRILNRYRSNVEQMFLQDLKKEDAGISEIQDFLERFSISVCEKNIPNGCLMVQSVMNLELFEDGTQKMVRSFFRDMKDFFKKALSNSILKGHLKPTTDIDREAKYLVGIAQSTSIFSKIESKERILEYVKNAIGKIG